MANPDQIEQLLATMSRGEKVQLLQWMRGIWPTRLPASKAIHMSAAASPALCGHESPCGSWCNRGDWV